MMQWAENTIQDLRFALRSWGKAPAFAIAAIATLAIGIGANAAIFTVVSGVLLRPLPFVDPQTLVQLYETQPRNSVQTGFDGPVVFQDFDQWRTGSRLLKGIITYTNTARNFQGPGEPEQVALRTREFGIRMTLGADAWRMLRLVMGRGALLIALGLAIGIAGATALTRVLRGVLYGVAATDAVTFGTMAAVLATVALVACLVPARRAARVDPSVALRCE